MRIKSPLLLWHRKISSYNVYRYSFHGNNMYEVMKMKKFYNVIRRNIFYIALVAGMAALVAMVTIYNMRTSSKDKENQINVSEEDGNQQANNDSNVGTGNRNDHAEETISDGAKTSEDNKSTTEDKQTTTQSNTSETDRETIANQNSTETEEETEEVVLDFDGSQGLIWPLAGNVIIPFNMDTTVYFETLNQYKCNPGMVIEATTGAETYAVYKCLITEVYSDDQYGNVVKASLGNGYEVMYGQLEDVRVTKDQIVEAGTVIGTVGEPTRFFTEEGTNLYFEISKDGVPVDPMSVID